MRETDEGEIRMSRREYNQLMAAIPASHQTGGDGFWSGLFGGNENDGPGFFDDLEIRHEDEHVIMDPEVIDFMGDSLEVERPNQYDNAVRIRVAGDVAIEGEHIEPKSVETESVHTENAETDRLASQNAIHPEFTQDYGQRGIQPPEFDVSVVNQHFRMSTLVDLDGVVPEVEGVAYKDGHIYFGENTGSSSTPATIYEYDTDGNATGETFTFGTGEAYHTNTMLWYDGYLWVGDAATATATTYIIDWESKSVVDTIAHEGDVSDELWRTIVPTTDGSAKLLFTTFEAPGAHLVDLPGARSDGTTSGNVEKTLTQGVWNNIQAGVWRNGYYYWSSHNNIAKVRYPFGDHIEAGFPASTGQGIEWFMGNEDTWDSLEDMAYNPDDDVWYIGESNNSGSTTPRIYEGSEEFGERILPAWDVGYSTVDRGTKYSRSLKTDSAVDGSNLQYRISEQALTGRLEIWFYDDGATNKKSKAKVGSGNGNVMMGTDTGVNASNYIYKYESDSSASDSGVSRQSGDWVVFAWIATGNGMELQISTDYGTTWTDVATQSTDSAHIKFLTLQTQWESDDTTGVWGHGTVRPFYG